MLNFKNTLADFFSWRENNLKKTMYQDTTSYSTNLLKNLKKKLFDKPCQTIFIKLFCLPFKSSVTDVPSDVPKMIKTM